MAEVNGKLAPGANVAAYYARRAGASVGLILSEGTVINRPASSNDLNIPHFYGEKALAGWQEVINRVHAAGGSMGPQIWHMGVMEPHPSGWLPDTPFEGPSGLKSATASSVTKPAKMETGLVVQVPPFINEGEKIRVDTAEGAYLSRA